MCYGSQCWYEDSYTGECTLAPQAQIRQCPLLGYFGDDRDDSPEEDDEG